MNFTVQYSVSKITLLHRVDPVEVRMFKNLMVGLMLVGLMLSAAMFSPTRCPAGLIGADSANDVVYDNGWTSGDNGGSGFAAWALSTTGVNSGHFIGNSTSVGGPGANINVVNESFGMFGHSTQSSIANRSFTNALNVGDEFSADLAVNFRNGAKGFNLYAGGTEIFNFNVGSDDYRVNGNSIGNSYSANTQFRLLFTQSSASAGTWRITRSGGVADVDTGTYSGIASGFRLYVNGTDNGSNQNNFFANNFTLTAIPEPSSMIMVILGLAGSGIAGRRRRF